MSIAEVIGWKFNHQEGMSTVDGVINNFPITEGVTLTNGIPSQADQDTWTAEYEAQVVAKEPIHTEIQRLEALETPRRLAEAFADPTWLNANRALIATERAKL